MDEYKKFKHLLEYFVAHLEWLINNNENSRYKTYIKPLIDNRVFLKTGIGYNNERIQKQIVEWCNYENGYICISIQFHRKSGYKARTNYLNWADTGINVIAKWNDNNINSLALVHYDKIDGWKNLGMDKPITELGLYDNNEPNDNLKMFFDKYNGLIIECNKNKQNIKKMEQVKPYVDLLYANKNLILTGAPGTGKTYLAKQIAMQMIGVTTDEELEQSGQFSFVQFHPSFDYTDFVEGLRPTKPDENGNIGFELKDGVFKEFCKKAFVSISSNFDEIYDQFIDDIIQNNVKFETPIFKKNFSIDVNSKKSCYAIPNTEKATKMLITKEMIRDYVENGNIRDWKPYTTAIGDYLKHNYKINAKNISDKNKPFVFIIDEINRGEISKIFGELFFSIEPSYRGIKGAVKTQYSNLHEDVNEIFYVPENVYIIGTMNDIDRSVESFDFAMRRRFAWKEISANESQKMFENENWNFDAKNAMDNLNVAISQIDGLNSSYHIGAAYFKTNVPKYKNNDGNVDWNKLWELHLRPLLFEYMRGLPKSENLLKNLKTIFDEPGALSADNIKEYLKNEND